jgi:hypothetical protein
MTMMDYTIGLTIINALLIGSLTVIYYKNYRSIRAQFNLGLLLFASVFLLQKLVSIYVYMEAMHDLSHAIALSIFVLEILQAIAFSIMVWLTIQ